MNPAKEYGEPLPENFNVLVGASIQRLYKVAGRFFRNREDIEDVVQESLFAAYRHWDQFDGRAKRHTWLHSIVVNRALMELRSRRLKNTVSLDQTGLSEALQLPFLVAADSLSNVERAYYLNEEHRLLYDCLDHLPESYGSVLRTYYLQELDIRRGAAALGISCSAFKSRLFRGRRALSEVVRKRLQNHQSPLESQSGADCPPTEDLVL